MSDVESDDDDSSSEESEVPEMLVEDKPLDLQGMAYERFTTSYVRLRDSMHEMRQTRLEDTEALAATDPGLKFKIASECVRALLAKRYGSVVKGWRLGLDLRGVHKVTSNDFYRVLMKLGYGGDKRLAFEELGGKKKSVTLADLDPSSAQTLSEFYRAYVDHVGPITNLVAGSDAKRIGRSIFVERCRAATLKSATLIDLEAAFNGLETGEGSITEEDCLWLEYYVERKQRKPSKTDNQIAEEERIQALKEEKSKAAKQLALSNFKTMLRHKFGSVVAGWRQALDQDGEGQVTWDMFEDACAELGFKGDMDGIWEELLEEEDEFLVLEQLEPLVVEAQQSFVRACVDRFGSMQQAFVELDVSDKPLVRQEEFDRLCIEINMDKNRHILFESADAKGVGMISLENLHKDAALSVFGKPACDIAQDQLSSMEPPIKARKTIFRRAAEQCSINRRSADSIPSMRKELVDMLVAKFESPVRAWANLLDLGAKGKLKKKDFLTGVSVLGYTGNTSKLWEEMGLKPNGSLRFKDLCPEIVEEVRDFKTLAGKKVIGLIQSSETAAGPGKSKKAGVKVNNDDFWNFLETIEYEGDGESLLLHLDPAGVGYVNTRTLRILNEQKTEERAIPQYIKKYRENVKIQLSAKIAAISVPPKDQLLAKQDKLLGEGRSDRKDKKEKEQVKMKFIRALNAKFGSIAKAWRLALDPDNSRNVENWEALMKGLKRAGQAPVGISESELRKKAEFLFDACAPESTGVISLEDLDSLTPAMMDKMKDKCEYRYGSLQDAFETFDPEGTGRISVKDFVRMCHESQVVEGVHRLVDFLDPRSTETIELALIDSEVAADAKASVEDRKEQEEEWQQEIEKRGIQHMYTNPKPIGVACGTDHAREERAKQLGRAVVTELKQRLVRKFGTLTRAWREAHDNIRKDIGKGDFMRFFSLVKYQTKETNAAWETLVDIESEKPRLSLLRFEPAILKDLRLLKQKVSHRYGSTSNMVAEVDTDLTLRIDFKRFLALCYECQYEGNERRLFEYLDRKDEKVIHLRELDEKGVNAIKKTRDDQEAKRKAAEKRKKKKQNPDDESEEDVAGKASSASSPKPKGLLLPVQEPAPSIADVFRSMLDRRFRSLVKAWKAIDSFNVGALKKDEFCKGLGSVGYAGNAAALWKALLAESKDGAGQPESERTVSMRDINTKQFRHLAAFRQACKGTLGSLEKAFEDDDGQLTRRYTEPEFIELCERVDAPKPWKQLYSQLNLKSSGVSWDDVRFMEEQWTWQGAKPQPIRGAPAAGIHLGQLPGSPMRTEGFGHLCFAMRPRQVSLRKSSSLPSLRIGIRSQWNDRHEIKDHLGNKDMNLIHLYTKVQTQQNEIVAQRVLNKLATTSTMEWLENKTTNQKQGDDDDLFGGLDEEVADEDEEN